MDSTAIINIATAYAIKVETLYHPQNIILFGSYANGSAREQSDIDIAVIFNGYKGNWLDDSAQLWNLTLDIDDRIEPVLLDSAEDQSGFVENIYKNGIVLK